MDRLTETKEDRYWEGNEFWTVAKEIYIKGELPKNCKECDFFDLNDLGNYHCILNFNNCKLKNDKVITVEDCPLHKTTELAEPLEQRIKVLEKMINIALNDYGCCDNCQDECSYINSSLCRQDRMQELKLKAEQRLKEMNK